MAPWANANSSTWWWPADHEWEPAHSGELSRYACSPHRIELAARLIRDAYLADYANAALRLLPEWKSKRRPAAHPISRTRAEGRLPDAAIDWSDAAIVDPAYDFGLLYRDLGPAALRIAIHRYRTDANDVAALSERAVFYARCSVFEDLEYGIETGRDKYVDKCLAAMEWLFPV